MQIYEEKKFLTPRDLVKLGIGSIHTLHAWRSKGIGPKFITLETGRILYRSLDVENWIQGKISS